MIKSAVCFGIVAWLFCAAQPAQSHDGDEYKGKLGSVSFPSTCDAKIPPLLERGVAMLHSIWYSAGERTFREVLAQDPGCAIATWGIAAILMSNPLAGQGASPAGAQSAQAAIDQGRKIGAKSQREADYIEAVAAYHQDFGNRTERARQEARAKAFDTLAQRYPDDDEAQIFSALYTGATQQQSDQTYSAYLKAAGILEKQFAKYPDHPGVAQVGIKGNALVEAKNGYWATEVEIQRQAANDWIAFAKKDATEALKLMRAAADLEDRNEKHIVTPGRILPARELLGDMLMELNQPAAALAEYEASQVREPNRFRGLYGAARAVELSGNRAKAADYYAKLLALTRNADGSRPELATAKAFVAAK